MKKKSYTLSLLFALLLTVSEVVAQSVSEIRVACIGNSITYGSQIKDRDRDSYPAVLDRLLGEGYDVKNFGLGGRTLLNKGDRPYMNEKIYQDALAFNPHIVIIKLGTNDSKSFNWKYKADFTKDLQTMVDAFKALPAQPEIYLCYPSKAYQTGDNINDDIIGKEIIPMIDKVAKKNNLPVIDLYTAMDGKPEMFPDRIHPNEEGAKVMAKTVYRSLKNGFGLVENNAAASIYYAGSESVINTTIEMLTDDSKLVCKQPFQRVEGLGNRTIVIGIPDREPELKRLTESCSIHTADLSGKWEAFKIVKAKAGDNTCLFVLGSDPRGTAYGILELSRELGISPWVWWADVVPERREEIVMTPNGRVHAPSVQYRGIFLNDEDWALMPWSTRTYEPTPTRGAIGPKTYARIFELLLRLRANTIWPAMHECTVPFYFVEGNREMAEKYGIVVSTSHAEPMMRTNTGEWNSKQGPFNFLVNEKQVLTYWDKRAQELAGSENIYTIGMRGIHDGRMEGVETLDDETAVLRRVIKEQRDILKRNNPGKEVADIPQQFIPYKEVLKAYGNGLEVPEDITMVWCDDNHGYIMRLSNPEEQKRSGGGGVYYHISYWGKPHDYLWLASTQPGLIYTEMKRAWDNNARRLWILNVGDIKPGEYLTEFFLDMAWNIDAFSGNTIYAHQQNWTMNTFGPHASEEIHAIMKQYYHLAGHRKPEHLGWNNVEEWSKGYPRGVEPVRDTEFSSTVFGDEMERRINAYNEMVNLSNDVYKHKIPNRLKAAYFQLIHYPVVASGAMNRKMLYAQKSRDYAKENPELAAYYARLATEAYHEITALDYAYNKDMLGGKWELMMDMKPRDLPVFQSPVLPGLTEREPASGDKLFVPRAPALTPTAGTPVEGDRMIALNACDYVNDIRLETIDGLGHSGKAVRLPVAKKIKTNQPHLEYKVTTMSQGEVRIKVGIVPQHSVHGDTLRRYAVVVDNEKPLVMETHAGFLSTKWAENVLRNQSLTEVSMRISAPGEHVIRIYAMDEELIVDQLMLEFDGARKYYLIPVGDRIETK